MSVPPFGSQLMSDCEACKHTFMRRRHLFHSWANIGPCDKAQGLNARKGSSQALLEV